MQKKIEYKLITSDRAWHARFMWMDLAATIADLLNRNVMPKTCTDSIDIDSSRLLTGESIQSACQSIVFFLDYLPDGADERPMLYAGRFVYFDTRLIVPLINEVRSMKHPQTVICHHVECSLCGAEWPVSPSSCEKCGWSYQDRKVEINGETWLRYFKKPFELHHKTVMQCFNDVVKAVDKAESKQRKRRS